MKKSNKIFFVFLVVLPLMMIAYNLLLQAQYAKGNLIRREPKSPHNVDRPLKPFRHLVFNGKAVLKTANNPFRNEVKRFLLEVGPEQKPQLSLNSYLNDFVKERYSGDTLYISFEIGRLRSREDFSSYDNRQMKLSAPSLASLSIREARMQIASIRQETPLKVMIDDSYEVIFHQVEVPVLTVSASNSTITFASLMRIDSLWYEAVKPSMFYFNTPNEIKKVGGVDSLARISISGSASMMRSFLNKQ